MSYSFRLIATMGILLITFCTCEREKIQVIPSEVEGYVDSFFQDANRFGHELKIEHFDLIFTFTSIEEDYVSGRCNIKKGQIEIDSNRWNSMSNKSKEWLIYHELGHCILEREHFNEEFANGECKSIMKGGVDVGCSTNFISNSWKEYYKSELFTEKNNLPGWYDLNFEKKQYDSGCWNYIDIDTLIVDGRFKMEDIMFASDSNFQVRIYFEGWQLNENCVHLMWDNKRFYFCNNGKVTIMQNASGLQYLNFYYDNFLTNVSLGETISLCVENKNGFYYFFVDSLLVHVMDFENWENNIVYTNSFDGSIRIGLNLFNF